MPPPRWPVSVKGVVLWDDAVVLLRNERHEWELPGGRLEVDETPERCVVREIDEEVGVRASVAALLDAWVHEVVPGRHVLIVTYGCTVEHPPALRLSAEHDAVRLVPTAELDQLPMPDGYRASVRRWRAHPAASRPR